MNTLKAFLFASIWLITSNIFCSQIKNEKCVFLSDRDKKGNGYDIFITDLDSGELINLTSNISGIHIRSNSLPKINEKRQSIFFVSFEPTRLMELNLLDKELKEITSLIYEAIDYSISPNCDLILFTDLVKDKIQLFIFNLIQRTRLSLTNDDFNNREARFSPDGLKIVYVSDADGSNSIYMMNIDGTGKKILTNNFGDDRYPSFSPDGMKLVFSSSRSSEKNSDYDLYLIDTTRQNFKLLLHNKSYNAWPIFTADGKCIIYLSNRRGAIYKDIFIKEITTGKDILITDSLKYINGSISLSKDGNFILFENNSHLDSEIFLYDIKKRNFINISKYKGRDLSPSL